MQDIYFLPFVSEQIVLQTFTSADNPTTEHLTF